MHGAAKVIDFTTVDDSNFNMMGAKPEGEGEDDGDESKLRVHNLPQSQRAYAEKLVLYIGGERIPCLMYSQKWNLREKGVQEFANEMPKCFATAAA